MRSYQQAFYELRNDLTSIYETNEASAIAHALLEYITGLNKLQRLSEKEKLLNQEQELQFETAKEKLLNHSPLQHITHVQWFLNFPFYVNEHVLIPRPETEELVQWIIEDWYNKDEISILDLGTGSGIIPISLQQQLKQTKVSACDISKEALKVAMKNAENLKAQVDFFEFDMLEDNAWRQLRKYHILVSNPPYIPFEEKELLDVPVKEFEPCLALFALPNEPLIFYQKIARNGKYHLEKGGAIYCEIHQDFGHATKAVFEENGFSVELKKDIHGNDRMLKAFFSSTM